MIDLIYFDAGGGHKASALALSSTLKHEHRLVNLREIIAPIDIVKNWTGICIESIYNRAMITRYSHFISSKSGLRILHFLIRRLFNRIADAAHQYWFENKPEMIVSLIPHFNSILYSVAEYLDIPYVTIITDMEECHPHFWIEDQFQYYIVGTKRSYQQILPNYHIKNVYAVNGLLIHPKYLDPPILHINRWNNNLQTALVCFGGYGSNKIKDIMKSLKENKIPLQLEIVCGHNENLFNELINIPYHQKLYIHKFVDLTKVMSKVDFMIGKPGPGLISEAIAYNLPVLVDNTKTMIQERYNIEWAEENKVGKGSSLLNPDDIIEFMDKLSEYKRATRKIKNDAVFEIPKILEEILLNFKGYWIHGTI